MSLQEWTGRQSAENCVTLLRELCPVSHSTQGIQRCQLLNTFAGQFCQKVWPLEKKFCPFLEVIANKVFLWI
jgi:hypothetical protein